MEPLKPIEKVIEPDGRWDLCGLNFSRLYEVAAGMDLPESVPERVRVQFQQAQHLLIYSYLQFSLVSVALTQAFIAVECALRTRSTLECSNRPAATKSIPGLKRLLSVAVASGWIKDFNPAFVEFLPTFRNDSTHGEYMLSPIDSVDMVRQCGQLIQQLFPMKHNS